MEIPDAEAEKIKKYLRRQAGMRKDAEVNACAILYEAQRRKIPGVPLDAVEAEDYWGSQ